jgi:UDP-glucose:(glucosyl)LPS alpha-1,2-glucosyltransferase
VQVIETPIEPLVLPANPKPTDKVNLIYCSTPQRGLDILVPVFEQLAQDYDNIHLDVYSSFKIYGWDDVDSKFEKLFDRIRKHPKMTYHGFVKQDDLRTALLKAHILAYPNIWKETSCRALIESMSAGLLCVHPNYGALPDTSGGLTAMYQFNEDVNKHANLFKQYLEHAIGVVNKESAQNYLKFVKTYADSRFNIDKISSQWNGLLKDLSLKYPTVESRKFNNNEIFVYRT